jgi:hypothetical protein
MPRTSQRITTRKWRIVEGDCFDGLAKLDPNTVDAVITDPPYGIGVNGVEWARPAHLNPGGKKRRRPPTENPNARFQQFSRDWSAACLHSLKPGGHILAFAAARTAHRLTCGLEEAGLEVRDVLMWLQGQGYPATRLLPDGLGTGLKPAWEPIILARKPVEGSLDQTLATHGTGAMNIDGCRIALTAEDCPTEGRSHGRRITASQRGRWPANLVLSHGAGCTDEECEADCPIGLLASATASSTARRRPGGSARPAASSSPAKWCRRSRSAHTTSKCAPRTRSPTSTRRSSQSTSCAGS